MAEEWDERGLHRVKGYKSNGGSNRTKPRWEAAGFGDWNREESTRHALLSACCSFFLQLGSCFLKYHTFLSSTVNHYHIWNILPDILGSTNISTCPTFRLTGDGRVTVEGAPGGSTLSLKWSRNTVENEEKHTKHVFFWFCLSQTDARSKRFQSNSLVCYESQFAATSTENALLCTACSSMPYKDMSLTDDYSDSANQYNNSLDRNPSFKKTCF